MGEIHPPNAYEFVILYGPRLRELQNDAKSMSAAVFKRKTWNCPAGLPKANHPVQGTDQTAGPDQWPARGRNRATDGVSSSTVWGRQHS